MPEENTLTTTLDVAHTPLGTVASFTPGKINQDINRRVQAIEAQMNIHIKEREQVIHGVIVGRVGQLHVCMVGPGGTGKSYLARDFVSHITGAKQFEAALDETSDPSQVLGPPNVKTMVHDGKVEFVTEGMLPDCTDAFLDEFFNANVPLLHSIMPILNERILNNAGQALEVPLRQAIMGTNLLNMDAALTALFDRVHLRYKVDYISSRTAQVAMVEEGIARLANAGKRGVATGLVGQDKATVSVEELDIAFQEAINLDMPEPVLNLFFNLREELKVKGIEISDRRAFESMIAVMANAWVRNHEVVLPGDLDILTAMWWLTDEQYPIVRAVVLDATNPGEKAAMDLLDGLDELKAEIRRMERDPDLDKEHKRKQAITTVTNIEKLIDTAKTLKAAAEADGHPTDRVDETLARAEDFKKDIARDHFGL